MNFKEYREKMIEESFGDRTFYHGTTSDFKEFDRIGSGNQWGKGHYFTPSPVLASEYATGTTTGAHARGGAPEGNAGPNVRPVQLKMRKPFVMDAPLEKSTLKAIQKHVPELTKDYLWSGMKNRDVHQMLHQNFLPTIDHANSVLRKVGFDGIREKDDNSTHMVFHHSQIRSIFDPEKE